MKYIPTKVQHRELLKEISDLAFAHGYKSVKVEDRNPMYWTESQKKHFLSKCNEGFKIAQESLIDSQLYYEALELDLNSKIKICKKHKLRSESAEAEYLLAVVKYRIKSLKHIADGIAWQIIRAEIHALRRLSGNSGDKKRLTECNLPYSHKIAQEINEDENSFALINDLTNNIRIGDLLVRRGDSRIEIMELKDGVVNREILEKIGQDPVNAKIDETTFNNPKKEMQARRIARQHLRMEQIVKLLTTDKGYDPFSKEDITLKNPTEPIERYYDELVSIDRMYKLTNSAVKQIDGVIFLGCYSKQNYSKAYKHFIEWAKPSAEDLTIFDLSNIVNEISEPIFCKPISTQLMLDILCKDVIFLVGICFNNLINYFISNNLKAKWISMKQAISNYGSSNQKHFITVNKKCIEVENLLNQKSIVMKGTISKMVYGSISHKGVLVMFSQ